ncbi:MAG: AI-2E family transporter, partial [Bacillota bacterium]|nr:AI-2E family transporter [Bacillota bacterium]
MNKNIRYIIICVIVLLLVYFMIKSPIFRGTIDTIFISFIIAYSLKPLQEKIIMRGLSRKASALILLLGLLACICIIFIFLIPSVLREIVNITSTFDELKLLIERLNISIERLSTNRYMKNIIEGGLSRIEGLTSAFFNNALDNLLKKSEDILSFAVIPILVYYLLSDGPSIGKSILIFMPLKKRRVFRSLSKDINLVLSKYILSQFLLSALIVVMTFVVLMA